VRPSIRKAEGKASYFVSVSLPNPEGEDKGAFVERIAVDLVAQLCGQLKKGRLE
jgi:hypothetical protein